jgi:IS1 family transposase
LAKGKTYEVDELRTFVKKKGKLIWVVSAYCRESKEIVRLSVGPRTYNTLNRVLISLQLSESKEIYTDQLKHCRFLIEKNIHSTKPRMTNHLEGMHLNLRTHLKRLHRRRIGFSRSVVMLTSILKIYLWR